MKWKLTMPMNKAIGSRRSYTLSKPLLRLRRLTDRTTVVIPPQLFGKYVGERLKNELIGRKQTKTPPKT